jgi:hypothetical protein
MRANISECLLAAGFLGCLTAFNLRSGIPSQEKLSADNQVPTDNEVVGLDIYKVAVLVSVGIAILSLCL